MAKKTIGRIDKADFPLLDIYDIDIKIDTGAYTSSMHCHKANTFSPSDKFLHTPTLKQNKLNEHYYFI